MRAQIAMRMWEGSPGAPIDDKSLSRDYQQVCVMRSLHVLYRLLSPGSCSACPPHVVDGDDSRPCVRQQPSDPAAPWPRPTAVVAERACCDGWTPASHVLHSHAAGALARCLSLVIMPVPLVDASICCSRSNRWGTASAAGRSCIWKVRSRELGCQHPRLRLLVPCDDRLHL